jgi:hypothetical protein
MAALAFPVVPEVYSQKAGESPFLSGRDHRRCPAGRAALIPVGRLAAAGHLTRIGDTAQIIY